MTQNTNNNQDNNQLPTGYAAPLSGAVSSEIAGTSGLALKVITQSMIQKLSQGLALEIGEGTGATNAAAVEQERRDRKAARKHKTDQQQKIDDPKAKQHVKPPRLPNQRGPF